MLDGLIKTHRELDKADKATQKSLKKEIDQSHKSLEALKERISHYEAQLEQEPSEGNAPSDDGQIRHGAQAKAAPALVADDTPSESTMTPVTPVSDPPPVEDQTQDMEVDNYGTCPSLPSPVSHEDDNLLSGPPQSEVTEVESGLAHLSVSSPRGPNGEGEEASHWEALPLPHHSDWVQNALCLFSCSFVSKACTGLGNGCERFAHRDLC